MAPYVAVGLALGLQIGNVAVQASVGLALRRIGIHISTNVLALRIDLRDVRGNVLRARRGGEKRDGECGERQAGESLVHHLLRRSSRSLACRRCTAPTPRPFLRRERARGPLIPLGILSLCIEVSHF